MFSLKSLSAWRKDKRPVYPCLETVLTSKYDWPYRSNSFDTTYSIREYENIG